MEPLSVGLIVWLRDYKLSLKTRNICEIQKLAHSRHVSRAEWVRQALDLAGRREPLSSIAKKLEAVQAASRHTYPTGEIDRMLGEIEEGCQAGSRE